MTGALRVLDTGLAPGRWNVAVTAALSELAERHPPRADILRFHRYEACALLGRSQRLAEAVDPDACRRFGAAVARRMTGGGAVYMQPAMLAFDLVGRRGADHLGAAMEQAAEAVAAMLRGLGLAATVENTNAVLVSGAKICGLSGSFSGAAVTVQASVMIDAEPEAMAAILAPQLRGQVRHAPITTIRRELGRSPAADAVASAIAAALARSWPAVRHDRLSAEEQALAARHHREVGSDDFVFGGETHAGAC